MILTVTLNAALDRTLTVPSFASGHRHRATDAIALPGGKGVNVARALKCLGEPVIATGLAGGRTGTTIIEELTAEGILNDFVRIREESRASTAVVDPMSGEQTEINEVGPRIGRGRDRGAVRQAPVPVEGRGPGRAGGLAAARRPRGRLRDDAPRAQRRRHPGRARRVRRQPAGRAGRRAGHHQPQPPRGRGDRRVRVPGRRRPRERRGGACPDGRGDRPHPRRGRLRRAVRRGQGRRGPSARGSTRSPTSSRASDRAMRSSPASSPPGSRTRRPSRRSGGPWPAARRTPCGSAPASFDPDDVEAFARRVEIVEIA